MYCFVSVCLENWNVNILQLDPDLISLQQLWTFAVVKLLFLSLNLVHVHYYLGKYTPLIIKPTKKT